MRDRGTLGRRGSIDITLEGVVEVDKRVSERVPSDGTGGIYFSVLGNGTLRTWGNKRDEKF